MRSVRSLSRPQAREFGMTIMTRGVRKRLMRFPLVLITFVVVYAHRKVPLPPASVRVRDDK